MQIPQHFIIYGVNIYSLGIFIAIGILIAAFVIWQECKKDGFDEEKSFDLLLLSLFFSIVTSRFVYSILHNDFKDLLYFWKGGMDPYSAVISFLASIYLLSKLWKWSVFRVLDIFSLAATMCFSIIALGFVGITRDYRFLFAFAGWIFMYAIFSKMRNMILKSGMVFSIFSALTAGIGIAFFNKYLDLKFYVLLVTLSLVVLCLKIRKSGMKQILPTEFIAKQLFLKSLIDKLKSKERRLDNEQTLLSKEDPYTSSRRDMGNAEESDGAVEDIGKNLIDTKKLTIFKMIAQVKKALAKFKIGTYGICEVCKNPIDKARLKAYPEATTCVEHAAKTSS